MPSGASKCRLALLLRPGATAFLTSVRCFVAEQTHLHVAGSSRGMASSSSEWTKSSRSRKVSWLPLKPRWVWDLQDTPHTLRTPRPVKSLSLPPTLMPHRAVNSIMHVKSIWNLVKEAGSAMTGFSWWPLPHLHTKRASGFICLIERLKTRPSFLTIPALKCWKEDNVRVLTKVFSIQTRVTPA